MDGLAEIQEVHIQRTGQKRYIWGVKGPNGGVHIWANRMNDKAASIVGARYYGGIEVHRAKPDEYDDPKRPSHDKCWLIGKACWHDGSSLQFEEQILTVLENVGADRAASHCLSVARDWYHHHMGVA